MPKSNEEIKNQIASAMVAEIDKHGKNWMKPWFTTGLPRNIRGTNYRGVNCFWLGLTKWSRNFESNTWATFKQINQAGGRVNKGESGTEVVLWKPLQVDDTYKAGPKKGQDYKKQIVMQRFYSVFNLDQTNLTDESLKLQPNGFANSFEVDAYCENYMAQQDIDLINENTDSCFYSPSTDQINMVPAEKFKATKESTATQNYYSTLLHEMVHSTGNEKRLDRLGKFDYAFEELVAEMGAHIQCVVLGITREPKPESAQYLKIWSDRIKDDSDVIFKACAKAQQAVTFIEENVADVKKQIIIDEELKLDKNKVGWIKKIA